MLIEVKKSLPVDVAICTAAVTDFKPTIKNKNKLKKDFNKMKSINLEKNKDILEYLGKKISIDQNLLLVFLLKQRI